MSVKRIIAATSLATALGCGAPTSEMPKGRTDTPPTQPPTSQPPTSCIARGSRVRRRRGWKRIEELAEGDDVLCVDPLSGELVVTQLTHVRSAMRECIRLSFDGGALTCTSDHPLYCPVNKEWAPAGDWALGKRTTLFR